MNRNLLLVIAVLLFLGLLGIGTVQIFWLKGAVKSREQEFDKAVFTSLNNISTKIEDINYKPLVSAYLKRSYQGSISTNENGDIVLNWSDTSGREGSYKVKSDIMPFSAGHMHMNYPGFAQTQDESYTELDNLQALMLQQMTSLQPINELIDTARLKTIITDELKAQGIKTKYYYGVTEYAPNNFVLLSKGTPLSELFKSDYSIDLFRRSMIDAGKTLKLFFPDRKKFLYTSMSPLILSSAFFYLMIVAAFFLAFKIIFKQKKLSDMKTDFINNMTHELKTPIATISIASEMLRDNSISASEENRSKYAGIIFEENKRLYNHVEQVLQLARLEKDELQLNLDDADIHQLITTTAKRSQLRLEELGGKIELHLDALQTIVKVDEMHFTNMINNLIDNAIKYNDKEPLIKIKTLNVPYGIQIEVCDNGIGIKKENLERIFEKFYRVSTGNVHDTKGFGLGLSYVKSIVDKLDGKIRVESKWKEGTKFIIQLPLENV